MKLIRSKPVRTLLAALFWFVLWQLLSAAVGSALLLPAPLSVVRRLFELMGTAQFWRTVLLSLLRISAGIVFALILGVITAVLTCRFALLDALLSPVISVIKTTPVASFVVLVLIWLRRDYVPVLISALMVFPVVWSNVSAGIKSTDRSFLELARVYDFSFIKTARSIYFPSVLPYFRSACSSALGFGWKSGIAAEVLTVPGVSIGRMIYESKLYLQTTDLFAWTLCVILLSFLLEKLMLRLISGGRKNA